MKPYFVFLAVLLCLTITLSSQAQIAPEAAALAKESEAACAATAKDKPTIAQLKEKVAAGVELINKEGKAAYPKFKGKDSPFFFCGTYIWINDLDGNMLMHPIKPGLEGKSQVGLKDKNGYKLFVELCDLAKKKDEGWIKYVWPKPGTTESELKFSYFKKAKADGVDVVICSGGYASDMSPEEAKVVEAEIESLKK